MKRKLTPMKAIRARCLDCCCGSSNEVKECTAVNCPLWGFRLGHKPLEDVYWDDGVELSNEEIARRKARGRALYDRSRDSAGNQAAIDALQSRK